MANIISIKDGVPVLENPKGLKLEIFCEDGKYGLGQLFLNGVSVGGVCEEFVYEDTHYCWDRYQASQYVVRENNEDTGIIDFKGTYGVNNIESTWIVTLELTKDSTAFVIDAKVGPYMWGARYHKLFLSVPFNHENMECISYPMEPPILPPFTGHWSITPDTGKVPLMLGRELIDGKQIHVGIGYPVECEGQDYTQGGLWYDTNLTGREFRIDFPYEHYWIPAQFTWDRRIDYEKAVEDTFAPDMPKDYDKAYFKNGAPYRCRAVVSVAKTQSECVWEYKDKSGFSADTILKHDVRQAIDAMLPNYACSDKYFYEPGKGYRTRGWNNSRKKSDYYDFLMIHCNNRLAYVFYNYWAGHREETWARERAFEMINFSMEVDEKYGIGTKAWNADEDVPHGLGNDYVKMGVLYDPHIAGHNARYIDMTCDLVQAVEGFEPKGWRETAQKEVDWIVDRVFQDKGALKGAYRADGVGINNALEQGAYMALRYFSKKYQKPRYMEAMVMLEEYTWEHFGKNNDWYNGIGDNNVIKPPIDGEQYKNYYTLTMLEMSEHFLERYFDTKNEVYLQRANDMLAYSWMGRVPVNMPESDILTKGIVEEQNIWPFYDSPWPEVSPLVLLKFFRNTGNRFYAEYFRALLQTQLDFVQYGAMHPLVAAIMSVDTLKRQPAGKFNEWVGDNLGIDISAYSAMFMEDMNSQRMYLYTGGEDWGIGMDYELDFEPSSWNGMYVTSCTSRVNSAGFDDGIYTAWLTGRNDGRGVLNIKTDGTMPKKVLIGEAEIPEKDISIDIYGDLSIVYDLKNGLSVRVEF